MRVTNTMIANQILIGVRRSLSAFLGLQTRMSTGRRINKPSDDPIGTQRDIGYRTQISRINQYLTNISSGKTLLTTYDNNLGELKNLAQQAMDIGLAVNNETNNSPEVRLGFSTALQSVIDNLFQIVNGQLEGRYIYSGFRTSTSPITLGANGARYVGDFGAIKIEADRNTQPQVNINAAETLLKPLNVIGSKNNLRVGVAGTTPIIELNSGLGVDLGQFTITDNNLGIVATIDLSVGSPTTVDDIIGIINTDLVASGITNLMAQVGPDRNIHLIATPSNQISLSTNLDNLNGGTGIDLDPGTFRIHNSDNSIDVEIDISSATNISDVLYAINSQLTAAGVSNVATAINGAGTGINITDANGVSLNLFISETDAGQTTASNLGLSGPINPILNGRDMSPLHDFTVTEGAGQSAADLGILGSFNGDFAGEDLNPILTLTSPVSLLRNGDVGTLGQIRMSQGTDSRVLDLGAIGINTVGDIINAINTSGLNVTASINALNTGIQVETNSTVDSFMIEDIGSGSTAWDIGLFGVSDLIGATLLFKNLLDDPTSGSIKVDRVEKALEVIRLGMDKLLGLRGSIGSNTHLLRALAEG